MKAYRVCAFGLAIISLICAQENVNLTGTVKNQFNNPMVDATVVLLGSPSVTAKTSNSGEFALTGEATGISRAVQANAPGAFNINIHNGNLEISIKEPAKAGIELFDARGMMIGAAQFSEGKTSAVVPVKGKAFNALFARVNVGNKTYIEKFISSNRSSFTSYQSSDNSGLAKKAATAAAGQLIILHDSYAYDTVDINTLDGSVDVTMDIPDMSGGPYKIMWPKGGEVLSKSETIWLVAAVNPALCYGDNSENYCQISTDVGISWNYTTAESDTCEDGDLYPCSVEYTSSDYWDPDNMNPGIPGYFKYMDQEKNLALCFWKCDLADYVGTETVWKIECRYCLEGTAISNPFTVQQ